MGGATTGGSNVADANLNVVPFIDLLICLICFLVVSAAWTSLSRIDVDQVLPKSGPKSAVAPPDKPATLQVAITATGFSVNVVDGPKALATPTQLATLGEVDLCRNAAGGAGGAGGADGAGGASYGAAAARAARRCAAKGERYQRYDHAGLRAALERLMAAEGVGPHAKVMVAAGDEVPYLQLITTLDSVLTSCVGEGASRRCLSNPSIADMAVLRARSAVFLKGSAQRE